MAIPLENIFQKSSNIASFSSLGFALFCDLQEKGLCHREPVKREVVMYQVTEWNIRLNALESHQALAIYLDRDSHAALQFIKEKIVDKYFQTPCRVCSFSGNGANS